MLELDHVTFSYGDGARQYHFDLKAGQGEILAIMGASGSGKSTLLELIAGFLIPSSGNIVWDGMDLVSLPPEQRPCSFLFQKDAIFGHINAFENVALGINGGRRLTAGQRQQVNTALGNVGLDTIHDGRADTLSGGQQQRVALARCLVQDKPVMLMDEPFTGLDDDTRHGILDLVARLAEEQDRCILMVTHDDDDANRIATRTHLLSMGRLGETEESDRGADRG